MYCNIIIVYNVAKQWYMYMYVVLGIAYETECFMKYNTKNLTLYNVCVLYRNATPYQILPGDYATVY